MLDTKLVKNMPKLGFGLMRLPKTDDVIDIEQTKEMVDLFLAEGFQYFDSAYVYNGSEEAACKALTSRHPRDSYYITSKVNVKAAHDAESAEQELFESLRREGVSYIDFYLLHAISKENIQKYNDWRVWDMVKKMKEKGYIRHYGFSFHDDATMLDQLLTEHPDVDFVQLQINYADWENPIVQSRACYEVARKHEKPIIVMEPIKGGTLANPPEKIAALFQQANPNVSCASWALRFAASLPGVMVVLSGMSDLEQVKDNICSMKDFRPLSAEEMEVIHQAQKIFDEVEQIPCTACRYCVDGCPQKINIPEIFKDMNHYLKYENLSKAQSMYENDIQDDHGRASSCVQCGQCEQQCPQHIFIRSWLKKVAQKLEKE